MLAACPDGDACGNVGRLPDGDAWMPAPFQAAADGDADRLLTRWRPMGMPDALWGNGGRPPRVMFPA